MNLISLQLVGAAGARIYVRSSCLQWWSVVTCIWTKVLTAASPLFQPLSYPLHVSLQSFSLYSKALHTNTWSSDRLTNAGCLYQVHTLAKATKLTKLTKLRCLKLNDDILSGTKSPNSTSENNWLYFTFLFQYATCVFISFTTEQRARPFKEGPRGSDCPATNDNGLCGKHSRHEGLGTSVGRL